MEDIWSQISEKCDYVGKCMLCMSSKYFSFLSITGKFLIKETMELGYANVAIYIGRTYTISDFETACLSGSIDLIKYLEENVKNAISSRNAVYFSITRQHIHLVEYLIENNYYYNHRCYTRACELNNLPLVKYLDTLNLSFVENPCIFAARAGSLEVLKWMHENKKLSFTSQVFKEAVMENEMDTIKYLFEIDCPIDNSSVKWAAWNGNLDLLKKLMESGYQAESDAYLTPIAKGGLEIIKYLRSQHVKIDAHGFAMAISLGKIEVLKWMYENGCTWIGENTPIDFVFENIETIEYICEKGYIITDNFLLSVCRAGHAKVLEYLKDKITEKNIMDLMKISIKKDKLDCVAFLHKLGCKLFAEIYVLALKNGSDALIEYLCNNNCPMNEDVFSAVVGRWSDDTIQNFIDRKCPWDEWAYVEILNKNDDVEKFKLLHTKGCPWNNRICIKAAENQRIECMKYYLENEKPTSRLISICMSHFAHDKEIIQYLNSIIIS